MNTVTRPEALPRPAPRVMISAPPAPPPARTWFRLYWLAGIALLTASLVGASHVLNSRPTTADTNKAPAERSFAGPAGVVCLGTVDLEIAPGGFIPLFPVQAGEVTDVLVYESQPVKKGDVLLKVDNEAQIQTVALAEVGVRLAEAQFAQAQQLAERYKAGVEAQSAAVEAGKHKITAAEFRLHRERDKFKAVNQTQTSNSDELNAVTEELNAAKSALAAEEGKLHEIQATRPDAKIREAEEGVAAARQKLEQARLALRKCVLEAPADGTILRINVAKGAVLGPQSRQAAMLFAPAGPRVVRAEVEQEFAHRVQAGMTAVVQDEAGGQSTWHGRVKRLGAAYLPKRSNGGPESFSFGGSDSRVLECLIELEPGQPQPLIGQKVRVNIGTHGGP
jgi:multidrug resistance efflux pump